MTQPVHKKFEFGTVFGAGGRIVSAPPPREKKFYTPEEVEEIRKSAQAAGESSAMARAQMAQAAALQALADAAQAGLSGLNDAIFAHKQAAVRLALVCAQKIGAEALERFPEAPLTAALDALNQEIEPATRLVLSVSNPSDELKAAAEEAAMLAGFAGAVQFREHPTLPKGGFEVMWSDGRAEYNPQSVFEALENTLNEALEAEAYHQSRTHE
ncbi:MAG: flagellar assembly protein FliH [Asticcacaulis sp.]|uniref:flagellar assembly protein FliH n=1 Tax=Asticcacaulis sp. TaxID=1872648 RepID=UPI0039E71AFF